MDPEKLTRWLQAATAPLVALGTLTASLLGGVHFLAPLIQNLNIFSPSVALGLAVGLPVVTCAIALWFSLKNVTTPSTLLRPERFDLRVRKPENLIGRQDDIDALLSILGEYDLVFVDGESGSGKTSLVQFGLSPLLRGTRFLFPIVISRYSGDWDSGLALQVYHSFFCL